MFSLGWLQNTICLFVTPCSLAEIYRHYSGTYCIHLLKLEAEGSYRLRAKLARHAVSCTRSENSSKSRMINRTVNVTTRTLKCMQSFSRNTWKVETTQRDSVHGRMCRSVIQYSRRLMVAVSVCYLWTSEATLRIGALLNLMLRS
jgi:hypothetical protein